MILLFTHGEKRAGRNPGLTKRGFAQMQALSNRIAINDIVICGTGKRHLQSAEALGVQPKRYSDIVGNATSGTKVDAVFADGTMVPLKECTSVEDGAIAMKALLKSLPDDNSAYIIIGGRPTGIMLGKQDTKSATLYRVDIEKDQFSLVELYSFGKVDPSVTKK